MHHRFIVLYLTSGDSPVLLLLRAGSATDGCSGWERHVAGKIPHVQGWRYHSFSGKPMPEFHATITGKKFEDVFLCLTGIVFLVLVFWGFFPFMPVVMSLDTTQKRLILPIWDLYIWIGAP